MTKFYLLLTLFISSATLTIAQKANEYKFYTKTGVALEDMSSGINLLNSTNEAFDEYTSPLTNFGFNFHFAGSSYTSFTASSNGLVALGNTSYTGINTSFDYLSQSNTYPLFVAYGDQLITGNNGLIKYKVTGAAGSKKLVIDFFMKSAESHYIDYANKHFQIWLFEGSNKVQYVYGTGASDEYSDYDLGIASAFNETLRVKPSSHTYFTERSIEYDVTWPGAGRSYIFSPTEIVETVEPAPVVTPLQAKVSMSSEYFVPGQLKSTIYLGYGLQTATLTASEVTGGVEGNTAYTYLWSANKGSFTSTAATVSVSPTESTIYSVAISDAKGNKVVKQITVYVMDVRCAGDKIAVCRKGKLKCVEVKHVKDVLEKDDAVLGYCGASASSAQVEPESEITNYPNPSSGLFTLDLKNYFSSIANIYIISEFGEVVSTQSIKMETSSKKVNIDLTHERKCWYYVTIAATDCIKSYRILVR